MVQRRAARWVKQDYRLTSSVSDMMEDLQWSTLCECRKYSRLTTFYKFLHQDPPDINIPEHYLPHSLSYFTYLSHAPSAINTTHNIIQLLSEKLFSSHY